MSMTGPRPASNLSAISFERDSVMEFGLYVCPLSVSRPNTHKYYIIIIIIVYYATKAANIHIYTYKDTIKN